MAFMCEHLINYFVNIELVWQLHNKACFLRMFYFETFLFDIRAFMTHMEIYTENLKSVFIGWIHCKKWDILVYGVKWSEVAQSCPTFCNPWTVAHKAPPSMGFSKQEYWSGLPWPPRGDLPDPGFKPMFLMSPALAVRFFTTSTTWEAHYLVLIVP